MRPRPRFQRNVADSEFARARGEQGWVDLNITFLTAAVSG
jgi:hypothetical protein